MRTDRRTFLQGAAGATLALPWLESIGRGQPVAKPATRLAIFYVPIGVVRRGFFPGEQDAAIPKFTSNQEEIPVEHRPVVGLHNWRELTPTQQPLEGLQHKLNFISGMDRFYKHGSDVHAQCGSCFLSSATADSVTSSVYPIARTLDHIVGDAVGQATPLRTLELSCNSHRDNKESIHFDNISWYGTSHVAPSLREPRKVFQRLFGTREIHALRNITDLVLEDARTLQMQLGRSDRDKFAEYFDSIRSIERQMDQRDQLKLDVSQLNLPEPPEAYLPRGEYIQLMCDLLVAALQTGLTRVSTLMIGPERWDTPYMYEGLFEKPMSHHQMSHNQERFVNELLRVDRFHMEKFAYLVRKMDSIHEADGSTLLDNTLLTYGSGLGDGATHQYTDLPIIMAGSAGGQVRTGHHLHCPDGTPLANLWLTQAQLLGLPLKQYADSTSTLGALLA
jgi:hypothetical protein